jgi:hypothetical protein
MELMWLPVPPDVKERGKSFVDTVIDRAGTGITGFAWLGLAALGLGDPSRIHWISIAVMGFVLIWLLVIFNARGAYLAALRDALTSRKLDLSRVQVDLVDAEAQRTLARTLSSPDPREVHFALYLLEDVAGQLPDLSAALEHDDAGVRLETLRLLARRRDPGHRQRAIACLNCEEVAVQEAAILYLHLTAPSGRDPLIDQLPRLGVDKATVDVIKLGVPAYAMSAADDLRAGPLAAGSEQRIAVLRLLGGAPPEMAAALLAPALEDEDPEVVRAALAAAGRSRAAGLVPQVCALLGRPGLRLAAAACLRGMGEGAVEHLSSLVADQSTPREARAQAIQLLGATRRAALAPLLLDLIDDEDRHLARRALRALNRLRGTAALELEAAQRERVSGIIAAELEASYRELLFLDCGSWADQRASAPAEALLERVLFERVDQRVERIFRLLALEHDPSDIYASYLGVRSPTKTVRASSIEFLDNVLPKELTARLVPLLEDAGARHFAGVARQRSGLAPERRDELLRRLLAGRDELLLAVAAWTVGAESLGELRAALEGAAETGLARGVAARAIERLKQAESWEEPKMGLTAIEKALKLQKVDVLQRASTDDLAHIAQITTEVELEPGTVIYGEGDAPDALFVVITGRVRLHRDDAEIAVLGEGEAFGSWALIDESPRVASATTVEQTTLLKVSREEFQELLADRVDIVQAVFRAMVERLRNLANIANNP